MKKSLKKDLKLKSGEIFPKGSPYFIKVDSNKPVLAYLTDPISGRMIMIRSINLHKYFAGFVSPLAEMMDPDFDDCIVPSLTGENVEPDGWDEKGFPSILLAIGYI